MYAPNNRASIFVRQKLIEVQEQFDEFTMLYLEMSILNFYQKWMDPVGRKLIRKQFQQHHPSTGYNSHL